MNINHKFHHKNDQDSSISNGSARIHLDNHLGIPKSETPIRITMFNAAFFSMAPAVPPLAMKGSNFQFQKDQEQYNKVVKLKAIFKFQSTSKALSATPLLIDSKPSEGLPKFLRAHCDDETLVVSDSKLGNVIKEKLVIPVLIASLALAEHASTI